MKIQNIKERKKVADYLLKRNLLDQYKKAKQYVLEGRGEKVDLKLRHPKKEGIWQFRINRQYRAFGFVENEIFKIAKISDHQE